MTPRSAPAVRRAALRESRAAVAAFLLAAALTGCSSSAAPSEGEPPAGGAQVEDAATAAPSTWAIITDFGNCDEGEREVAEMVAAWEPEIIATAGDNTQGTEDCVPYADSVDDYYSDFVHGSRAERLLPVAGNHDHDNEGAGASAYLEYFSYLEALPGSGLWYSSEIGNVNLFMLDSELAPDQMEIQRAWLREALQEARSEPDEWNIVFFHRPPFTSGPHEPNLGMRPESGWDYAAWGADLVVTGHQHVYEELNVDGLPYLVAGVGAGDISRSCPIRLVEQSTVCVEGHGAIRVTAARDLLTLEYRTPDGGLGRTLRSFELARSG